MFTKFKRKMRNPPHWKHLRDIWDFQSVQPDFLSRKVIKGVTNPNHIRISWSNDGTISLQNKAWMTSDKWEAPILLCNRGQVKELRHLWPDRLHPAWPDGFENKSLRWLEKLKMVFLLSEHPTNGIDHCQKMVRHELPEFLPTDRSLPSILTDMRIQLAQRQSSSLSALPSSILDLAARIAPHTSKHLFPTSKLMSITTETAGSESYCEHECEAGAMAIFRTASNSCPIQLGQVLRVMREQAGLEKVVIAPWWPVPDPEK